MTLGLNQKILHVDLTARSFTIEEPDEHFYRRFFGGRGLIAYYLLKTLERDTDPFAPENALIFAPGLLTGHQIPGSARNSIGAKSPLTGAYGDAEVGGYWGAEFKRSGFDALVVRGCAESPVYLWIHDGEVEFRDATHLWGHLTGEVQSRIHSELGDNRARVAQIGPAGERLVRFATIMNDINRAAGRCGLGAVMGSKNLKAVAVRGSRMPRAENPDLVESVRKWLSQNYMSLAGWAHDLGTPIMVSILNELGMLPTRNYVKGRFQGAGEISGETMRESILADRATCFGCPVRCKQVVSIDGGPYSVDPVYGGPEFETLASFGSNCEVDDLGAIAKANELCAAYGLDTISAGGTIAFAMECFERGLLQTSDIDGLELTFGNARAMVKAVELICNRRGVGDILAEGSKRAAETIGGGSAEWAVQVKGLEVPYHEPRVKQGLGLGYGTSPTGADHEHNMHDTNFAGDGPDLQRIRSLGFLDPVPVSDLGWAKLRLLRYESLWRHFLDCAVICHFMPYHYDHLVDAVRGVTGWQTSTWELLKVGERALNMAKAFNFREGLRPSDDRLPRRFFQTLANTMIGDTSVDPDEYDRALARYHEMMGWDPTDGQPGRSKLAELDLCWVMERIQPSKPALQNCPAEGSSI